MAITFTGHWARVDADLAAIIAEVKHAFIFPATGGKNYGCVITRAARGSEPMEGGMWQEYAGKLITRRVLFDTVPKEGDSIIVSGATFFVGRVTYDDSNPVMDISYRNNVPPK